MNELRKDYVIELFWGFLGIAAGSALPAVLLVEKIGSKETPLATSDFVTLCMFFVFAALTLVMGVFWFQRSSRATKLIDKIRNRPKAPVGTSD